VSVSEYSQQQSRSSEKKKTERCIRIVENDEHTLTNATVAVDVGDVTLWSALCLTLPEGVRTLYSERLGTMGYALCAGVASILAKEAPATSVVVAGDAGFQMTLQELATFMQHKRPGDKLIVIVLDNELMARVVNGFEGALGCELHGPDYVALAKAYGGDGIKVDSDKDAESAVKMAVAVEGLFLLHVILDPHLKASMAAFKDNSITVMNSG